MTSTDSQRLLKFIKEKPGEVMSAAYLDLWNEQEQARIDRDIAAHRMV